MGSGSKKAVKSTAIWGGIIALLPLVDQILVSTGTVPAGLIPAASEYLVSAAGALLSIWGRIKADTRISGVF